MDVDIAKLQDFFLRSAAQTYAGGGKKEMIPDLPSSKVYRVEEDNLLYVDMYWTNG
ncbi:MAG: hypothetical protein HY376_00695 [Candidatus Blackburnbacteria bacterium]|nr:hypothetical protein [Candidatus Blackburnbacteria bacterium]